MSINPTDNRRLHTHRQTSEPQFTPRTCCSSDKRLQYTIRWTAACPLAVATQAPWNGSESLHQRRRQQPMQKRMGTRGRHYIHRPNAAVWGSQTPACRTASVSCSLGGVMAVIDTDFVKMTVSSLAYTWQLRRFFSVCTWVVGFSISV